jgi:hypothetical protein
MQQPPWRCTQAYANNRMEADHGQPKRRLRPMRGLKRISQPGSSSPGTRFLQNIRRGHYELGVDEPMTLRVVAAFDELVLAIWPPEDHPASLAPASPNATVRIGVYRPQVLI